MALLPELAALQHFSGQVTLTIEHVKATDTDYLWKTIIKSL